jgi:hypothetical protein
LAIEAKDTIEDELIVKAGTSPEGMRFGVLEFASNDDFG